MSRTRSLLPLLGFVALTLGIAALGGVFTSMGQPAWYDTLQKPSFNPPSWVFGPVWTTLYVMMAVAAWLVWRKADGAAGRRAIVAWAVQLALNLGWSALFFALRSPAWALAEIVVLWLAILVTVILFFRHSRLAGWLMVPYLAWVSFAAVLNFAIVRLN